MPARNAHGAGFGPVEPGHETQERRLAQPLGPNRNDGLTLFDLQRNAVDGDDVAEAHTTSSISSFAIKNPCRVEDLASGYSTSEPKFCQGALSRRPVKARAGSIMQ